MTEDLFLPPEVVVILKELLDEIKHVKPFVIGITPDGQAQVHQLPVSEYAPKAIEALGHAQITLEHVLNTYSDDEWS